ncbi:hypothetical protein ABFA25_08325 [Mycobacterium lepromatosis]|uniref:hypothetical protein n=1 Tax=Mycobacterium lepromatosis TaxID=480418 RepID=UPI003D80A329
MTSTRVHRRPVEPAASRLIDRHRRIAGSVLALALPIVLTGLVCVRWPSLRELDHAPELVVDPDP